MKEPDWQNVLKPKNGEAHEECDSRKPSTSSRKFELPEEDDEVGVDKGRPREKERLHQGSKHICSWP